MSAMTRDIREIIREEPVMRGRILAVLQDGPRTVPEIATAIDCPSHEVVFWIMGMRRYGWVHELKESEVEGYFSYALTERPS